VSTATDTVENKQALNSLTYSYSFFFIPRGPHRLSTLDKQEDQLGMKRFIPGKICMKPGYIYPDEGHAHNVHNIEAGRHAVGGAEEGVEGHVIQLGEEVLGAQGGVTIVFR
jgi:hypothetical protein